MELDYSICGLCCARKEMELTEKENQHMWEMKLERERTFYSRYRSSAVHNVKVIERIYS